jgi:hypothetical protein
MLIIEVGHADVDWGRLTTCQEAARHGDYAQVMAAFVGWLARDYGTIQERLAEELRELRDKASRSGGHRRTPGIVADLALGLRYFLSFAQDTGALTEEEADGLWERGWAAIVDAAAKQEGHQAASEPAARFLELLSAAVASGRAHVAGTDGNEPAQNTQAMGWRERIIGTGDFAAEEWQPQGDRIGWVDGENLYLEADASFRVAQEQARGGETLTLHPRTLRKRLRERGFLLSTDVERETLTVRRTIEGVKDRAVLHLGKRSLFSRISEPDDGTGHPPSRRARDCQPGSGPPAEPSQSESERCATLTRLGALLSGADGSWRSISSLSILRRDIAPETYLG